MNEPVLADSETISMILGGGGSQEPTYNLVFLFVAAASATWLATEGGFLKAVIVSTAHVNHFMYVAPGRSMGNGPVVYGPGTQVNTPLAGIIYPMRFRFETGWSIVCTAGAATQFYLSVTLDSQIPVT